MENIKNIDLNNQMTLEPRLQEYVKKISYYKKNNIAIPHDIKREHQITHNDEKLIFHFLKGNKNVYDQEQDDSQNKFIKVNDVYNNEIQSGFTIKYDDYKKDPRYEKLQKKMHRDKEAMRTNKYFNANSNNMTDDFRADGALLRQSVKQFDNAVEREDSKNMFLDTRPYESDFYLNVRNKSNRVYKNYAPQIEYNQYLPYRQYDDSRIQDMYNNDMTKITQKINDFKQHTDTIYQYPHDQDIDFQNAARGVTHQAVPLRGKNVMAIGGTRDVNSGCITAGLPERNAKFKSLGYPSSSDHSFQYISEDIQDPKHTVLPFPRGGNLTRLENNFVRARPFYN